YLVNTAKVKSVNTAKGKGVTSTVGKQGTNDVKSSACWVWRPKIKETSPTSQTIKNMMEDLLLLQAVLKEETSPTSQTIKNMMEDLLLLQAVLKEFCEIKGIKREFSNARIPQQNGVTERKNKTLTEAVRTMLADSLLPIPFWAEAVNTACYVQNMVLVTKPHNKIPYELLIGRAPIISFMRPFGYPVTILNTLDHLGKFDGKDDERFLVGYSINNKAFRVHNNRTKKEIELMVMQVQRFILIQNKKEKRNSYVPSSHEEVVSSPKDDAGKKSIVEPTCVEESKSVDLESLDQQMKSKDDSENTNSTNSFNIASPTVNTASDKDGTF
nr:retrovirus-related Pol polyprotein from transposon TNT 1-94 [Tanacetum cinerariifolium]